MSIAGRLNPKQDMAIRIGVFEEKEGKYMKKRIKIIISIFVISLIIALIIPEAVTYLTEGDIITTGRNMRKVKYALNRWSMESSEKYPQSLDEKTKKTNEPFSSFLLREDWYKPIDKKSLSQMIKFKPLAESISVQVLPYRIYIYTDGNKYKIVGGDERGILIPEDRSVKIGILKPKIIYSPNYGETE